LIHQIPPNNAISFQLSHYSIREKQALVAQKKPYLGLLCQMGANELNLLAVLVVGNDLLQSAVSELFKTSSTWMEI